jgi:hypothetical protein
VFGLWTPSDTSRCRRRTASLCRHFRKRNLTGRFHVSTTPLGSIHLTGTAPERQWPYLHKKNLRGKTGSLSPPFGLGKSQGYNDRTQMIPEKSEFTKAGDKEICVEAKVKATRDTYNWLLCTRGYFFRWGGGTGRG